MRYLAMAIAKGGTGKTTTTINLAHGLSLLGKKVLIIDADMQDQARKSLGLERQARGLADVLAKKHVILEAAVQARENLWLVSGGMPLVRVKTWINQDLPKAKQLTYTRDILTAQLSHEACDLDYVIFDTSPGWDILNAGILMCADWVISPTELDQMAIDGLDTFLELARAVLSRRGGDLFKYSVLPTMLDGRVGKSNRMYRDLEKRFSKQLIPPIRYNAALGNAMEARKTIFEYDDTSPGAEDYKRLTDLVVHLGAS